MLLREMIYKYDPSQPRDPEGKWTETGGGSSDKTFLNNVQEGNFSDKDFQSIGRGEYGAELVFYEDGTKGIRKDEFASETDPLQDGNREVAAYRMSDQLGLDVVPPTEFYSPLEGGRRSTVQRYVEDSRIGAELGVSGMREWIESHPEQTGRVILLDFLMGNSDRHFANFLVDSSDKLWAIDNGNMGTSWATLRYWERKFPRLDFEKMVKKNKRLISSWKKISRREFDSWFEAVSEKKTFKKDKVWENLQEIITAGGIPE